MTQVTWESFHHNNAIGTDHTADADRATELAQIVAAIEDRAAFAPLYHRYAPRVFGYCMRRLADRERAADATSQVFIRAIAALPRFRLDGSNPGATFRAWLFAIAHNVVTDIHRRHRHHDSLDTPDDAVAGSLLDPARSPEDRAIASDEARRLRSMLAVLPDRQRHILELRLADLTGAEIAEALDMSLSAVKSAQFRAYATLRERFGRQQAGRTS